MKRRTPIFPMILVILLIIVALAFIFFLVTGRVLALPNTNDMKEEPALTTAQPASQDIVEPSAETEGQVPTKKDEEEQIPTQQPEATEEPKQEATILEDQGDLIITIPEDEESAGV